MISAHAVDISAIERASRVVERLSVRAVVVTPEDKVLLAQQDVHIGRPFWCTPGGGLQPGEDAATALARELYEETGLVDIEVGPKLHTGDHGFVVGELTFLSHNEFFLVRAAEQPARPLALDVEEAEGFGALRWWTLDEIEMSNEIVLPRDLANLVRRVRADGFDGAPTDLGWVGLPRNDGARG